MSILSFIPTYANSIEDIAGFEDIIKASKRTDGKYNVVCRDGSIELGVTIEDIKNDQVCLIISDPEFPKKTVLEPIKFAGDGCKGDQGVNWNPEKIEINYASFKLETSNKDHHIPKNCNYNINYKNRVGWQFGISKVTSIFKGDLSEIESFLRTTIEVPFGSETEVEISIDRINKDDLQRIDQKIPDDQVVWSKCSSGGLYSISSLLQLNNFDKATKFNAVDLISQEYQLSWKQC